MMSFTLISQGLIFIPIVVSVLIYMLSSRKFNYIAFLGQSIITILSFLMWAYVIKNGITTILLGGWQSEIGIELRVDNLSMLFITMAIIIWWVVLIYSWDQRKHDFKFLFFLLFLEGSFIAFLQTNDFFTVFVLMEIVTIISAILILYKKDGISAKAGLYYLLFNSFGMMIYLLGLALLYLKVGTLNMSLVKEYLIQTDTLSNSYSIVKVSYACFIVSMCVKAALFPVYEWLPRAHTAAPAYISALLSGLLVKTGVFGLIRVMYVFQVDGIYDFMFYLGFFTAISGIFFAVSQKDIKAILAFSTISQIGLIIMSISNQTDIGIIGAYAHIFNHFLFKSLLFLGAGIIINEYGVRRVTEIKGIGRAHPLLTLFMLVGMLSITGAPLFVGFLSKSLMKISMESQTRIALFQIVSIGTMVYFVKFSKIFFGEPSKDKKIKKGQMSGIMILSVLCIISFLKELDFVSSFLIINNEVPSDALKSAISNVTNSAYSSKYLFEYLIMLFSAYIIYKIAIRPNSKVLYSLRHFRIKFQDAIISIILFLVVILRVVN